MKRMKKKVVAMVTLAMFVMTLLPMAAFAADAHNQTSTFATVEANPTVKVNDEVDAVFDVKAEDLSQSADAFGHVTIWATDKDGQVSSALEVYTVADGITGSVVADNANTGVADDYGYTLTDVEDTQKVVLKFKRAGEYKIHAADGNKVVPINSDEYDKAALKSVEGYNTVTVQPLDFVANTITATPDALSIKKVESNKVEAKKVTVTVTAKEGILDGQVVSIENTNSYRGLKVLDKAFNGKEIDELVLDKNGTAEFFVQAEKELPAETYLIKLTAGDKTETVTVTVEGKAEVADSIEALPVESALNFSEVSANTAKANAELADKVRFVVKNEAGEVITGFKGEPALGQKVPNLNADYIVVEGPRNFKTLVLNGASATTADVKLVPVAGTNEYTVALQNTKTLTKKGDYTVTVFLANGAKAVSNFTVGEYGTTQSIEIQPVVDTVVLAKDAKKAQATSYKVYAVDENGMKKDVTASVAQDGIGYDPVKNDLGVDVTAHGVKAFYAGDSKDVLGTKITLTVEYKDAAQDNKAFLDKHEFTVVDKSALADYDVAFSATEGKVLKNNLVDVTVENVNGDKVGAPLKVKEIYVDKLSQSNAAAKVSVERQDKDTIKIYSDKETTVDVQVVAWTQDNTVYSGTLTYKVGEVAEDPFADTLVALTIGSKEMIVNNEVVKIDAAPYVDKNWRTMVPLSAITEAFGVTPDWNEKDRTVTVEKDGVKIVMTIDKQTYTVNGKEAKMDTAPVIVNSRTMVPVRFIAEDLGFKVAPLYSTVNGTTEGVVITK